MKTSLVRILLVTIVLAVAGCDSADRSTVPGTVSMDFVGMSGTEVVVRLKNGLDRPIRIEGYRTLARGIQVPSVNTQIVCNPSSERSESELFGFLDGPRPRFVELSPKSEAKVIIRTTFPQLYQGSRCNVELMLEDRTIVGPIEFVSEQHDI